MIEFIVYTIVVLGILAFGIMILAYKYRHLQNEVMYYPEMPQGSTQHCDHPGEHGIERYERVSIVTSDGITVRGYMMRPSTTADPTACLVYFHGNAGNVGQRLPIARMFVRHLRAAVLMVDYRGYGLSDKVPPSEEGIELDAQAILDWVIVHGKVPTSQIFLMGTSLGGAVVAFLASQPRNSRKFAGVIIENSFTSISDMADVLIGPVIVQKLPKASKFLIPFLQHVLKPLTLFISWDNLRRMSQIVAPTLIISSSQDELIPATQHRALYDACKAQVKEIAPFPTGKHNDCFTKEGYCDAIQNFVKNVHNLQNAHTGVNVV